MTGPTPGADQSGDLTDMVSRPSLEPPASDVAGWPTREQVARVIDPEAFEPWEGWPIGQRDALTKADTIFALFPSGLGGVMRERNNG